MEQLRNLKDLSGFALAASDGEIGKLRLRKRRKPRVAPVRG